MSLFLKDNSTPKKAKLCPRWSLYHQITQIEEELLAKLVSKYNLRQDGLWVQLNALSAQLKLISPTGPYVCITTQTHEMSSNEPTVCARPAQLPYQSATLSGVLYAHVLEHEAQPWCVLEEIDRVLEPEGVAILLSFNPYSLWGLCKFLFKECHLPPIPYMHSPYRLRRFWLSRGYHIVVQHSYLYRPPVKQEQWWRRLASMEYLGQYCLPSLGGCYIQVVTKHSEGVTPIKFSWKKKFKYSMKEIGTTV